MFYEVGRWLDEDLETVTEKIGLTLSWLRVLQVTTIKVITSNFTFGIADRSRAVLSNSNLKL